MTRLFLRTVAGLVVLCLLAAPVVLAKKTKVPDDLPERYKVWLDEVRLLITKEERETFLTIQKDYQRDSFIERFWKIRDPYPGSGRNELREKWEARLQEIYRSFGDLDDERSEILLLNGFPSAQVEIRCTTADLAIQIARFAHLQQAGHQYQCEYR